MAVSLGGGSSLSRRERDEVRAEVDAEFEAEERGLRKKKRKNLKNRNQTEDDDLGSLFGGGITGKLPRYANKITLKVQFNILYYDFGKYFHFLLV